MNTTPEFLILSGDGINCENETRLAFENAGAKGTIVHINDLLEDPGILNRMQGLAIPGGFSFGDELGSGQVLALKIKYGLMEEFKRFVAMKRPIIGICNGFQVLTKLGLLPDFNAERKVALASNDHGRFIDQWTNLDVEESSVCFWTRNIKQKIALPVRHGEGRIIFTPGREEEIYNDLKSKGQIVFRYESDINGSYGKIAGICDETGLILGMMPHPEAFVFQATNKTHQTDYLARGDGQYLFDNIVEYIKQA